jgi:hypothetical protein
MRSTIAYFDKAGEGNTEEVLKLASARYAEGDIKTVVIASTFGETAIKAAHVFKDSGARLLIVGEVLDGSQHPAPEICQQLEKEGHRVIWGLSMGQMSAFTKDESASLVAKAYKRISEGFKVVCEIILIGTSAGFLCPGAKVLAIAGTHRGADTAIVAYAGNYADFDSFQILEMLCKPYQRSAK